MINSALAFSTGVITGFGIGGGTILVLVLTLFMGYGQTEAQGINLVYFLPSAVSALVSHIKNKRIDWKVSVAAGASGVASALLAAFLATKTEPAKLSRYFGFFLLSIAVSEICSMVKERKNSPPD
jgi:uncharacterized membrane protein YfcA